MTTRQTMYTRANGLINMLKQQPMTTDQICIQTGMNPATFQYLLPLARRIAADQNLSITRPVRKDGYLYRVQTVWDSLIPGDVGIYDGFADNLRGDIRHARTRVQDLTVAEHNAPARSAERRRIKQHLGIMQGNCNTLEVLAGSMGIAVPDEIPLLTANSTAGP
jgi:hypothetical protein